MRGFSGAFEDYLKPRMGSAVGKGEFHMDEIICGFRNASPNSLDRV